MNVSEIRMEVEEGPDRMQVEEGPDRLQVEEGPDRLQRWADRLQRWADRLEQWPDGLDAHTGDPSPYGMLQDSWWEDGVDEPVVVSFGGRHVAPPSGVMPPFRTTVEFIDFAVWDELPRYPPPPTDASTADILMQTIGFPVPSSLKGSLEAVYVECKMPWVMGGRAPLTPAIICLRGEQMNDAFMANIVAQSLCVRAIVKARGDRTDLPDPAQLRNSIKIQLECKEEWAMQRRKSKARACAVAFVLWVRAKEITRLCDKDAASESPSTRTWLRSALAKKLAATPGNIALVQAELVRTEEKEAEVTADRPRRLIKSILLQFHSLWLDNERYEQYLATRAELGRLQEAWRAAARQRQSDEDMRM